MAIEVGESVLVKDPDGDFTVTAFDANHCPGEMNFVFSFLGRLGIWVICKITSFCFIGNLFEFYLLIR